MFRLRMPLFVLLVLLVALLLGHDLQAAEAILLDGRSIPANLQTFSQSSVVLQPLKEDAQPLKIKPTELIRWGSLPSFAPRPRIVLHDGTILVAAPSWNRAGSIQLADDALVIEMASLNQTTVPRAMVAELWFAAASDPLLAERWRDREQNSLVTSDELWLVSGDVLQGSVESIAEGRLNFRTGEESLPIELAEVSAVRLATKATKNSPEPAKLAIALQEGTLLKAKACELTDQQLSVTLAGGLEIAGPKVSAVRFVQSLAGPVLYVSDLQPIDFRHTPYFDLKWNYAQDQNLSGGPLSTAGRQWLKGLAMHSASRLVYKLDEPYETLVGELSIQSSSDQQQGSVVFHVLVARSGGFESAYSSPIVRGGDLPLSLSIDITGARAIALVVDHADNGDLADHALWLDLRLIPLAKPAAR